MMMCTQCWSGLRRWFAKCWGCVDVDDFHLRSVAVQHQLDGVSRRVAAIENTEIPETVGQVEEIMIRVTRLEQLLSSP